MRHCLANKDQRVCQLSLSFVYGKHCEVDCNLFDILSQIEPLACWPPTSPLLFRNRASEIYVCNETSNLRNRHGHDDLRMVLQNVQLIKSNGQIKIWQYY